MRRRSNPIRKQLRALCLEARARRLPTVELAGRRLEVAYIRGLVLYKHEVSPFLLIVRDRELPSLDAAEALTNARLCRTISKLKGDCRFWIARARAANQRKGDYQ